MKEEIIEVLNNLLKYKTFNTEKEQFNLIYKYIKSIISKNLFIKEYEFKNNKALVISNYDVKEFDIIFCVHIDVVPIDKYVFYEDEDNIYGRGTIDMKGQVSVCINLMNNINTDKMVALFITNDEEIDGNCTKELLKIYNSKLGIVPDGGNNFNLIKEEKGLLQLKLSLTTKSAHASQPYNGENAIVKLFALYNTLLKKYPLPKDSNDYVTSINLSKIEGGDSINKVPSNAYVYLDIRHTSKDTKEKIIEDIKNINNNIVIEKILEGDIFTTNMKNKYIKKYIKITEKEIGHKVNIIGCESTSDAVYFKGKNIPTIIMNPIGGYPHCDNEYVNKESLYTLYKIYKEFIESGE